MSTTHKHPPGPPLPTFPLEPYGLEGQSDPMPLSRLVAAIAARCDECTEEHVDLLAADPILTCHMVAMGWMAISMAAEANGGQAPSVQQLAEKYHHTTASMYAAFRVDDFQAALLFAQHAERSDREKAVAESSGTFAEVAMNGLDGLPPMSPPMPPENEQPKRGMLELEDKKVPLLSVYVGLEDFGDDQLAHTWALWVHPDWPEPIIQFPVTYKPKLMIDNAPPGCQVKLHIEGDGNGNLVMHRHPG